MTDESNEAQRLIEEALSDVNLNRDGEICPQGDECAIHFRNDEETLDDEEEFGRIITYVGEHVVITSDNPDLANPATLVKLLLGANSDGLPALYETCVIKVGDGTLADLRSLDAKGQRDSLRFTQVHSEWSGFLSAHQAIVSGVREGWIDLSVSIYSEGK